MAVFPTEEEFELVRVLAYEGTDHNIYDSYEDYSPNEESCSTFAQKIYDEHMDKLKKLHSLKAYKWMESQISWKYIVKSLFKMDSLPVISKDEYVSDLVSVLLDSYSPITKHEYEEYKFRNIESENIKSSIYQKYGKDFSIAIENDTAFPSFEEANKEQNRLRRFRGKLSLVHYNLMRFNFEIQVLIAFRDYFHSDSYIDDHVGSGPLEVDIQFYKDKVDSIQKAYIGLKNLVSYIEKDHQLSESLGASTVELEQSKALLTQLNVFEQKIKQDFDWANEELGLYDIKTPIIKRKDKTSKERILSCHLWSIMNSFTTSSTIKAIEYFLQFEGVTYSTERRTIERWLKHWNEVYIQ